MSLLKIIKINLERKLLRSKKANAVVKKKLKVKKKIGSKKKVVEVSI